MAGFVSLVGAGPGDPELLTQRAVRRLSQADVVLHDALVDAAALELAPAAKLVFVGKRSGKPAVSQESINRLMVRLARHGRRVVRLKGGDPFVFGRGGEEAIALARAGVEFEIVPGVSSAIAAPALAGIPVTHRGVSASFLVVSGHAESAYGPIVDGLRPHSTTLVILMGVGHANALASRLLARGWSPDTPVAVLFAASSGESQTVVEPLATLAAPRAALRSELPGTIVIGDVVRVREAIGFNQDPATAGRYGVA